MRRGLCAAAVAAFFVFAAARRGAECAEEPKPFPFAKTTILASAGSYYVEGRVRIPKGVSITVQKDTLIVGRGDHGGVIEVEGELQVHGTPDKHDTFRDVTIEAQPKFGQILVDTADFEGKSSRGVVCAGDAGVDGHMSILSVSFSDASTIDVALTNADQMNIEHVSCPTRVHVKAVDPAGSTGNKARLLVINCLGAKSAGALSGGLSIENVADVTVRACSLSGDKVVFADCGAVTFDTNYVTAKTLEFTQQQPGRFGKTALMKCDFQFEKLVAFVPYVENKAETISVEHCWFDGEMKSAAVRDRFLKDRTSDPKDGVTIVVAKTIPEPQQLGWTVKK